MKSLSKKPLLNVFSVMSLVLAVGCGPTSPTLESSRSIDPHSVVTGEIQSGNSDGNRLSGLGSVLFNGALRGVTSMQSYTLQFELSEGGSLELRSNATRQLKNGVIVEFSRSGSMLKVQLKQGENSRDISSAFAGVDASAMIFLVIDVHNNETPAHILVWNGESTRFTEGGALFNSEERGLSAPGNGGGQHWGLVLNQATVSRAVVGAAKFTE